MFWFCLLFQHNYALNFVKFPVPPPSQTVKSSLLYNYSDTFNETVNMVPVVNLQDSIIMHGFHAVTISIL